MTKAYDASALNTSDGSEEKRFTNNLFLTLSEQFDLLTDRKSICDHSGFVEKIDQTA